VLFLKEVFSTFLPSTKECWTHKFRHSGVGQQYPVDLRLKKALEQAVRCISMTLTRFSMAIQLIVRKVVMQNRIFLYNHLKLLVIPSKFGKRMRGNHFMSCPLA